MNERSDRGKLGLTFAVAAIGLLGCAFVVYDFVADEGRIAQWLERVAPFTSTSSEPDERSSTAHWNFSLPDSALISITAAYADLRIERGATTGIAVDVWLDGAATDGDAYRTEAIAITQTELRITALPTASWPGATDGRARLTITIPDSLRLAVSLTDGALVATGFQTDLSVALTRSPLTLSGLSGVARIDGSQSPITIERCRIATAIESTGANIDADFNHGEFVIRSNSTVTVRHHSGSLTATSTQGAITAELLSIQAPCRVTTSTGDIHLRVLPTASLALQAVSDHGFAMHSAFIDSTTIIAQSPNLLRATLNDGSVPVELHTEFGLIRIEEYGTGTDDEP